MNALESKYARSNRRYRSKSASSKPTILSMPRLPTYALTGLLILSSLCGCASQCGFRDPLKDSPAPPPQMFSRCLDQVIAYGQSQAPISRDCWDFLHRERTK